jgi:hypothetical protein
MASEIRNYKSAVSALKKAVQWENGLSGFGRLKRIFFAFRYIPSKRDKNPFQSAESAQSVLPLYPFSTKQKQINPFTNI